MFSKLLLVAALGVAAAHPSFEAFLKAHPTKQYAASELSYRRALYYASVDKVAKANADPAHTFASAVNVFSDMTPAEIKAMKGYSGYQAGESVMGAGVEGLTEMAMPAGFLDDLVDVSALPASVDWRTKGVVTATKNQGGCGSCWAFSATEVMESAVAIASGKLLELAPQQLVSCAPNPNDCGGTGGCQGSVQWLGFNYTQHMGGMTLEKNYPYRGSTGTCDTSSIKPAAGVKGYVRLPANNYTALMNAVARVGPVAISVDASWGAYSGGVFNGACGTTIDHAVVLVGCVARRDKERFFWRRRARCRTLTVVRADARCRTLSYFNGYAGYTVPLLSMDNVESLCPCASCASCVLLWWGGVRCVVYVCGLCSGRRVEASCSGYASNLQIFFRSFFKC